MALTKKQKEKIIEYVKEQKIENMLAKDIAIAINALHNTDIYSARNVAGVLAYNEYCYNRRGPYESGSAKWCYDERVVLREDSNFFISLKKDKNILTFNTGGVNFSYDFNTNKLTSDKEVNYKRSKFVRKFIDLVPNEWLFNYTDLFKIHSYDFTTMIFDEKYKNCPKGYINYIKENNLTISETSYKEFSVVSFLKDSKFNRVQIDNLKQDRCFISYMNIFMQNSNLFQNVLKCYMIDIKNCCFSSYFEDLLSALLKLCNSLEDYSLDTNRGLLENIKLKKSLMENKENEILSNKLQKLNFLNNMIIEDYVIIVPQNLKDLQQEGTNQGNCVGSYYNNSIMRGENLIYFLRDKNNSDKSVITCRYNIECKRTSERRLRYNRPTTRLQDELCEKIDKIINENLK